MRLSLFFIALFLTACTVQTSEPAASAQTSSPSSQAASSQSSEKVTKIPSSSSLSASSTWNLDIALAAMPTTKDAWLQIITADQYAVLWNADTERPFSSPLLNEHRKGTFVSADCGEPLFRSEQKFDSGTGWPSFWAPITPDAVVEKTDTSLGIERTEVLSKCGGHLGHVFEDGPPPTGLRYCMNGLALRFIPDPVQ